MDLTVSQLIESINEGLNVERYNQVLHGYGIRICEEGLFLVPTVIERKLLRDTRWRGLNIGNILKRIPGAENTRRRIAGDNARGILLAGRKELTCG